MKYSIYFPFWLLVLLGPVGVCAQVPSLITYQGRVVVDGGNFGGVGEFRFSFVKDATLGTEAILWHNDGTDTGQAFPANAVQSVVLNGLFSVLLGDDSIPNMTAIPASVFTENDNVSIRVWFDDGTSNGLLQLSPDQRIAAVGYAMIAKNVAEEITLNAVTTDSTELEIFVPSRILTGQAFVDQSQMTDDADTDMSNVWQSFTAGQNGKLTGIELFPVETLQFLSTNILVYFGEGITGPLLFSDTVNFNIVDEEEQFFDLDFETAPFLTSGLVYTFQLSGNEWLGRYQMSGDAYPNGRSNISADSDFWFQTHVHDAEPGLALTLHENGTLETDGTVHSKRLGFRFPDGTLQSTAIDPGDIPDGHSLDSANGSVSDALFVANDGDVGIGITTPDQPLEMASGAHVTPGGAWTNASDVNLKENFEEIDQRELLEKLAALPIETWNYRKEDGSVRHLGPMAQDFFEAFGLGGSDKAITTVDTAGVALASIQALLRLLEERESQIAELREENRDFVQRLELIEDKLRGLGESERRQRTKEE